MSFGVKPKQPLPAQETVNQPDPVPVVAQLLPAHQAQRPKQPRRILTPPPYLSTNIPESLKESGGNVENSTEPRRSTGEQQQEINRFNEQVLELAGQQL